MTPLVVGCHACGWGLLVLCGFAGGARGEVGQNGPAATRPHASLRVCRVRWPRHTAWARRLARELAVSLFGSNPTKNCVNEPSSRAKADNAFTTPRAVSLLPFAGELRSCLSLARGRRATARLFTTASGAHAMHVERSAYLATLYDIVENGAADGHAPRDPGLRHEVEPRCPVRR